MSQMFGQRNCLAFDVGEASEPTGNLRRVDMWAAEKHLTYFDNSVYVPQFLGDIEHAIRWLRSDPDLQFPFPELSPVETHKRLYSIDDGLREYYWFFQWGPTTDGFSSLIFRSAEQVHLTFEVRQEIRPFPTPGGVGKIFAVTLPERDLLTILEQTAAALKRVPTPERAYPNQINPDQVKHMNSAIFDDRGIRFEYPADWELDVTDDGPRVTVSVQSTTGLAFALVTIDDDLPEPADLADEALAALQEEYPTLHAIPALEVIDGHKAVGHDVEFMSLDLNNAGAIRAFRTPRRTIFTLAQWSDDLEGEEAEQTLNALRRSLEETDA